MKLLAFIASVVLSSQAFAANISGITWPNESWAAIDARYDVQFDYSDLFVSIQNAEVSIFNVCSTGTELRTIQPETYCANRYQVNYGPEGTVPNGAAGERNNPQYICDTQTSHLSGGVEVVGCERLGEGKCQSPIVKKIAPPTQFVVKIVDRKEDQVGAMTWAVPSCASVGRD